ncbi:DUF4214 domain-containing protein [Aquihabitans daechungensis]|uniref:DUF4214 domain-containing protein n=1 Tax=Aquihabitans daechungensis TaxID=1052257 RepID=UPI003BA2259A
MTSLLAIAAPSTAGAIEVTVGDIVVDDAGGHVFATVGDTVVVYDLSGQKVATIADQYGAIDLMLRGRTLYVAAYNVSRINTVNADTFAVTGGWYLPSAPKPRSMAWSQNKIWFTYGTTYSDGLASLEPATGTVKNKLATGYEGADIAASESPARVYLLDRGSSPSKVNSFDITTDPPTHLLQSPHSNACSNGGEMALSVSGAKIWTACGSPYLFNEFDTSLLTEPAVQYPAEPYPNTVDRSADGRFILGGISGWYDPDLYIYEADKPVLLRSFEIGSADLAQGMAAIAADGTRIYAMDQAGVLHTWSLAPVVTSVSPSTVLQDSGAVFDVKGVNLAGVTSVKVGGATASFTAPSDTLVKVTLPAVAPGTHALTLTNKFGANVAGITARIVVEPQTPASPAAPTVGAIGLRSVDLSWSAPDDHGSAITGYVVKAYLEGASSAAKTVNATGTSTTVTGLLSEGRYRFTVAATNSAGTGGASPKSALAVPLAPDLGPFTTIDAFVAQQHLDLLGRSATASEHAAAEAGIASGAVTPEGLVIALRRGTDGTSSVDPMARLYRATFLRIPDRSGLDYWIGKKRRGMKLTAIAENFARSSEFIRRYGSLTDRKYVERLYLNVLGRAGDPGGIDYWTGKLTRRTQTRGQVLAGMSESNEYKRTQSSEVDVAVLFVALLRRAPSQSEFDAAVAALDGGGTAAALAWSILSSDGYAARF